MRVHACPWFPPATSRSWPLPADPPQGPRPPALLNPVEHGLRRPHAPTHDPSTHPPTHPPTHPLQVGHIKDIGRDPAHPETRIYQTSAAQPWHTDATHLVSLLCLKTAKEGGTR